MCADRRISKEKKTENNAVFISGNTLAVATLFANID